MNDYQTLLQYTAQLCPPGPVALGDDRRYRDLGAYVTGKLTNPSNDVVDVERMPRRALAVSGLDDDVNSANQSALQMPGDRKQLAVAATLLALSVIADTRKAVLQARRTELARQNVGDIEKLLGKLLACGDVVRSTRHSKLELKNFASAGISERKFRADAEAAYQRADGLLNKVHAQLLRHGAPAPTGAILDAFTEYFGPPQTVYDTTQLPFQPGGPVWASAQQSALNVVKLVLRKVCDRIIGQQIRLYFGGKSIDTGTYAYVSGDMNPTKLHVGGRFFGLGPQGLESRAGTLIHECTHTFARTDDHDYGPTACRALGAGNLAQRRKALTNADSYMLFIETAFKLG